MQSMDLRTALQRRLILATLNAPPALLRVLGGPPRRSPDGLELDLQTQVLVRLANLIGSADWQSHGVVGGRRLMAESSAVLSVRPEGALSVRDASIPVAGGAISARIYTPDAAPRPMPLIVFYHGGGFVLGSLDTHDGECRALALGAGAIVISVDYRLAPEHRFPTAVDDGLAAFRWAAAQAAALGGDARRLSVAGDSAGGNIAAAVARETRGQATAPVLQVLIYPALDMTRTGASHGLFRDGYLLTKASMDWFLDNYLGSADPRDTRASPLLAEDHAGLPPAVILTAGFDPLRDDGKAYAEKLLAAGVPVTYRRFDGLVHGFFGMSVALTEARGALEFTLGELRRGLGVSPR
jgi:acetyl esterase